MKSVRAQRHCSESDDEGEGGGGSYVDLEGLVDLCFQEEMEKRRGAPLHRLPPLPPAAAPDPKPVLVVKPVMRSSCGPYRPILPAKSTSHEPELEEIRQEDHPHLLSAPGAAADRGLLRRYRHRRAVAANSRTYCQEADRPEPGEILPDIVRLEPGEIPPALLSGQTGDIDICGAGGLMGSVSSALPHTPRFQRQELEPGEIPSDTGEEFTGKEDGRTAGHGQFQLSRRVFIPRHGGDGSPVPPLHYIAIASPMLSSPRKQQQTTSFAAPSPPQRQFSVITQVPQKRSLSPPRRDSQPPASTAPVVSAWPPNLAGGGQPVAVIHQHLTLLSSPPFLPDQSPSPASHQEDVSEKTRRTELISSDPEEEVARVIDSSGKLVAETKATMRKRRRQTAATTNHSSPNDGEGSAVVVKKRRIMQEYPVSLGITRNKVCYTLYRYQTTIKKRADWLYGLLVR
jgi:hypothetical protein